MPLISPAAAGRFRRDSFLLVASTIAVGAGNYGYSLALIWVLSTRQFAVVAAVSTLVVIAATAASSALPWVLAGEVARSDRHSERRRQAAGFTLATALVTGLAAAAVVVALSSPYTSTSDKVAAIIWVVSVFVVQVGSGYLQGEGRFAVAAGVSVIEVAIKVGLGLGLAAAGFAAAGTLMGAALATAGWAVTGLYFVGRDIALPTRAIWTTLWRRTASIAGVQVGVVVLTSLDVVIGAIKLRGTTAIAGYQAMLVFARIPMFISGAVSSVTYRRLVADGTDSSRAVGETMSFYLTTAVCVVGAVSTLPPQLLDFVLPHGYSQYVDLLLPLGIAGLAGGQINVTTTFFQAADRVRPALGVLWPGVALTAVTLAVAGVSAHDLAWAAAACTATVAVAMTAVTSYRYRQSGVGRRSVLSWVLTAGLVAVLLASRHDLTRWLVLTGLAAGATALAARQRAAGHGGGPQPRAGLAGTVLRTPAIRRRLLSWTTRAITSITSMAPPDARHIVLAARSMLGSAPLVCPPSARRAVVVAPHPDDETIGCGGTVALLARMGATVSVAVVTSGEMSVAGAGRPEDVSRVRQAEAVAACRALGISEPLFLGLPDGSLDGNRSVLAGRLQQLIADERPNVVFVPWPLDHHPDHMAVAAALAEVDMPSGCEVWAYEVWAALPPNRIVDVTTTWDAKLAALGCHASGRDHFDLESHLALSRWRSIFGLSGKGYAEAFVALPAEEFRRLVQATSGQSEPG